ncbi:hypothetical protein [Mucilaginibacter lappiensis]|uniref:hypothetical protein n=1 Tax=Mucilaginibacter lappiensis TaxID=354630 RepID=UPI003D21BF56
METSILHHIKKKAGRFIEPQLLKTGRVLDVRPWEPATLIEVDLHLPFADMQAWNEVPYIKLRVADLCYRDYTPFGWDAETHTCSILVDVAHEGPGSRWARGLERNDTIQYFKTDTTRQAPDPTHLVVGLGDESSLGHLLALQQMTLPRSRFCAAVLLSEVKHHGLLRAYFGSGLQVVGSRGALSDWVGAQGYCAEHTSFYLAGNDTLVSQLRTLLKTLGYLSRQIRVKGFWS